MPTSPTQMAEKLRKIANSYGKEAARKRDSGLYNQNPTPRRMNMLASIEKDVARLERIQGWALGLAEQWEKQGDKLPIDLQSVKTKKLLEIFVTYSEWPTWHTSDLQAAGIFSTTYSSVLQALEHYSAPVNQEKPIDREIRDRKRALVGMKIPGFFPTPEPVIQRMLELADIPPCEMIDRGGRHLRLLEPSAGWGNIADVLRERFPRYVVEVCEIVPALRDILMLKKYKVIAADVFNLVADQQTSQTHGYDYILSNPSFENNLDIAHVMHYYRLLRPGGRLVSVMCEGSFFRSDRSSKEFRDWFYQQHNGYDEKLPDGSFERGERPTGVAARLIVVDKSSHVLY